MAVAVGVAAPVPVARGRGRPVGVAKGLEGGGEEAAAGGARPPRTSAGRDVVAAGLPHVVAPALLRSGLGPTEAARRAVLARTCSGPAPFVPLRERLQPGLPGQ